MPKSSSAMPKPWAFRSSTRREAAAGLRMASLSVISKTTLAAGMALLARCSRMKSAMVSSLIVAPARLIEHFQVSASASGLAASHSKARRITPRSSGTDIWACEASVRNSGGRIS